MKKKYDVLGLGAVAVDELLYVDQYPGADGKVEVLSRERQCGGLTATALVAAARLGSSCAYAGVLGEDDDDSRFAIEALRREGIGLESLILRPGARPIRSMIVVDKKSLTRTIFYDHQGVVGADDKFPAPSVIGSARVLLVDRVGIKGMIRAARIARQISVPVVADLERDTSPGVDELIELSNHLIIPKHFALKLTGQEEAYSAAETLSKRGQTVVVTCGDEGCWFSVNGDPAEHQRAFKVTTVDPTGCGDVFHGAYAHALAHGATLTDRIRMAASSAAIKATQHGGQSGIPTMDKLQEFMKEQFESGRHD